MRVLRLLVAAAVVSGATGCGDVGAASIEFVEINPRNPRINDVVTVRVRAVDSRGVPQAGANVNFKVLSSAADNKGVVPGVVLNPTDVLSNKGGGIAETQLTVTGGKVNSVVLQVTSGGKTILTPAISFAGATANVRQLTFQCGETAGKASGGIHALHAYDPSRNLIAGVKVQCTAHVGDRNGDGVSGSLVTFMTEAGTIGPSETSLTDVIGNATILHKTSLPLPVDVAPTPFKFGLEANNQTGEFIAPLWMLPFTWRRNPAVNPATAPVPNGEEPQRTDPVRKTIGNVAITNNPRDNLVTMIAVTAGEEGFTDVNNNGTYDKGIDTFDISDDMAEPFVDSNDNGTYDQEERFIDTNGSKAWDGRNGTWDSNTLIWRQERLLWTGVPLQLLGGVSDTSGPLPTLLGVGSENGMPVALRCPSATMVGQPCAQAGPPVRASTYISDPWFNSLAQNGEQDGCSSGNVEKPAVVVNPKVISGGIAAVYPAGNYLTFYIQDARDPNAPPLQQVPKRDVFTFQQPVECTFTGSPESGDKLHLPIGVLTGTID